VAEQTPIVAAIARRIIDECRRDIEAARLHIEAMRAILAGSRWLLARWEERRRDDAVTGGIRLPAYDEMKASGFVEIEERVEPRRRRRRSRTAGGPPAPKSPLEVGSGSLRVKSEGGHLRQDMRYPLK
jgi:hypothetical protein